MRIGKLHKMALYALLYGASFKKASQASGLGLRRVKTSMKRVRRTSFDVTPNWSRDYAQIH